ncbi:MAG: caspase family protein [Vicinamibacteria bacterium]
MKSKMSIFSLGAVLVAGFGCASPEGSGLAEKASSALFGSVAASAGQQKLALLVGIDEYRAVNDLNGCLNDVQNMKVLLRDKFGFEEANIMVLRNEKATRRAIIEAFQTHLIAKAQRGDIVVFHYSGHGSQMKDASKDEPDAYDETIVPHDSRTVRVFDIPDDSINALLRLLSDKTDNVTVILDSCHSGTAVRASGKVRTVDKDEREPPPPDSFATGTRGTVEAEGGWRPEDAKYVLLSGSRSNQLSHEFFVDGKSHGAFTYFFTKEVREAQGEVTYRDVMDKTIGHVNARYPSQEPQIEGTLADNYVFGDESDVPQNYVLASPMRGDRVLLKAGQIQGLTTGSVYEVYAPGTKDFEPPARPLAKVELTRVDPFSAEGTILSGGPIKEAARAVERQHRYVDRKLRIYYKDLPESETLKRIKTELDLVAFIEPVSEELDYHLLLEERDGAIVTEGGDPTEISPRVSIAEPNVVERVVDQVSQWARWFNVLSIANASTDLEIKVGIKRADGQETRSLFDNSAQVSAEFGEGEIFEVWVENLTNDDVYLAVLGLSTDGSIALVYPAAPGAQEVLAAKGTWRKNLVTTLPPNRDTVKDVIKVFATLEPVDFSPLMQDPVRANVPGSSDDPLVQLLAQALRGVTRGVQRVELDNWVTAERVIQVKRQTVSRREQ